MLNAMIQPVTMWRLRNGRYSSSTKGGGGGFAKRNLIGYGESCFASELVL
jgi:hypothetical protein